MKYSLTLIAYMDDLSNKFYGGKISQEKLFRLTDKLVAWENVARKRKIK